MRNIEHILLTLILLLNFHFSFSQNDPNDLFEKWITKARNYKISQPDSCLHYCEIAQRYIPSAASIEFIRWQLTRAEAIYANNNYVQALSLTDGAIAIAEKLDDKKQIVDAYSLKGFFLSESGETGEAIQLLHKTLPIAESNNLLAEKAWTLNLLCEAHRHFNQPLKAITYQKQAREIYRTLGDKSNEGYSLMNLANAYSNWKVAKFDTAIMYYDSLLLPEYAVHQSTFDSARLYNNLGRAYSLSGKKELAEKYLLKSLELQKQINDYTGTAYTVNELVTLFARAEQYEKAKPYVQLAMELKDSVKQVYLKRNMHDRLYEYYYGIGDYKMAAVMADSARWIVEDIFDMEKQTAISELEIKFENKQELLEKENEINLLEQNRKGAAQQRNLAILGALFLAAFIFWFFKNRIKIKQQQAEALEKRNQELQELDTLKSRFFANISHELRTPLTLILGPTEKLLKNEKNNFLEEKKQLELIKRNANNLKKIVNDILDLSKLDNKKLELIERPIHFKKLSQRLFSAFESMAQIQGQQFQLSNLLPDDLIINIDSKKFEQIFNNLVSNALKYTLHNGKILVNIDQINDGKNIQLKVKDNGRGIHPDDLPYIFDRYFQSKQPDTPTEGGTGIGLALAKELAELMGGELSVSSEWKKGSIFTLILPLKKSVLNKNGAFISEDINPRLSEHLHQNGRAALTTATNGPNPRTSNHNNLNHSLSTPNPTLLLVEDNPDLQAYIKDILSPHFNIEQAMNGQQGLEKLNANPNIQLVISDVMMPEMDGFIMLEKIRENEQHLGLPVIMLTARADATDKMKALVIGVDDYLTKPFVPEELLVRINNLIARTKERKLIPVLENGESENNKKNKPANITAADINWLQIVETIVKRELKNTQYNLFQLADELNLSDRQVHRRIKKITGLTPNKYFRELKLHTARELIDRGEYRTISEVSYAVGFDTPAYLSKLYLERFGTRPMEG